MTVPDTGNESSELIYLCYVTSMGSISIANNAQNLHKRLNQPHKKEAPHTKCNSSQHSRVCCEHLVLQKSQGSSCALSQNV